MILKNYPELDIFKVNTNLDSIQKSVFALKEAKYKKYLDMAKRNLELDIEQYLMQTDNNSDIEVGYEVLRAINNFNTALDLCSELDQLYSFYQNIISYSSRLEGLSRYTCVFKPELFNDAYLVTDYLFNRDTRGQIYGYFDYRVNELHNYFNKISLEINTAKPSERLKIIIDCQKEISNILNSFTDDVNLTTSKIKELISPVVTYVNIVDLGYKILENVLGSYAVGTELSKTISLYNKSASTSEDHIVSSYAISSQIFEQVKPLLEQDSSNFTQVITKSIKLTFEQLGIKNNLDKIKEINGKNIQSELGRRE